MPTFFPKDAAGVKGPRKNTTGRNPVGPPGARTRKTTKGERNVPGPSGPNFQQRAEGQGRARANEKRRELADDAQFGSEQGAVGPPQESTGGRALGTPREDRAPVLTPEQEARAAGDEQAQADAVGPPLSPAERVGQRQFEGETPGMNAQAAAEDINVDNEQLAGQALPPKPKARSPLGNDSPIEKAQAKGHLRPGQSEHLRSFGLAQPGMSPEEGKKHEAKSLRDMDRFGEYDGMDDEHAPAPPIRPGKNSFNPGTGQWVEPEGQTSVMAGFFGFDGKPKAPNVAKQQMQAMQGIQSPEAPPGALEGGAQGPPGQEQ